MDRDASRPDPAPQARSSPGAQDPPRPEALRQSARALLEAAFGASSQAVADGFANGSVGLASEHTHYSDGFALLAPFARGVAVAARPAASGPSRLALAKEEVWDLSPGDSPDANVPLEARVAGAAAAALGDGPVQMAAVGAVPPECFDARLAALGMAATRAAAQLLGDTPGEERGGEAYLEGVRAHVAEGASLPFSFAPVVAAAGGATPPHFVLADTATREHLAVEVPPADAPARGLVVVHRRGEEPRRLLDPPAFHHRRREQAEEALRTLRTSGAFEGLTAFRDLEHRDLERALSLLPSALQPVARHLLTENRRAGKLVRAARTGDWQFFGALLLMSHASYADDWRATPVGETSLHAAVDAVVDAAESTDGDGLYGARATGRGPCVLVVGRAAALPPFFRRAAAALEAFPGCTAETMRL